jgi:hypothetical protein
MCNLHSIATNQAAIIALFRVIKPLWVTYRQCPACFPVYPAPVVRITGDDRELTMMR